MKILVPTDFSSTAQCAFRYAQHLADRMGDAEIQVLHVYLPAMEGEYPNIAPPIPEFMKMRETLLDDFITEGKQYCEQEISVQLKIQKDIIIGFPADEIVRQSKSYDLIVMGTTGENDILDRTFGSVSSNVAQKAHCPLVMVPRGVEFGAIEHIMYAANYESVDETALRKILEFNRQFQACLHFVHVKTGDEQFQRTKDEIFKELFAEGEPSFSFEIEEVEGETVAGALNGYAEKHGINLAVAVSKNRNFWQNLIHKSQTKRMAMSTRIPLMVLHL